MTCWKQCHWMMPRRYRRKSIFYSLFIFLSILFLRIFILEGLRTPASQSSHERIRMQITQTKVIIDKQVSHRANGYGQEPQRPVRPIDRRKKRCKYSRFPDDLGLNNLRSFPSQVMVQYRRPRLESDNAHEMGAQFYLNFRHVDILYPKCPQLLGEDEDISVSNIVFVTGASADHHNESFDAVASVQIYFPDSKIVYYDLGLNPNQVMQVNRWCGVVYRKFNFHQYPIHFWFRHTYAWKAIAIQEVLKSNKAVIWFDTSIRFQTSDLSQPLTKAKEAGGYLMLSRTLHSTYAATDQRMFQYLPVDFLGIARTEMYQSGFMIILNTRFVRDNIMLWFLACSLHQNCIAPEGSSLACTFGPNRNTFYALCHRYDQSVINVILVNLFHYNLQKYTYSEDGLIQVERFPTDKNILKTCPGRYS